MKAGEMKSLMQFVRIVVQELGQQSSMDTQRDFEYIESRVKTEGLSFLTITLSDFGKDFLEALDLGRISSTHFSGFRKRASLPAFLQGFFKRVFTLSGTLLDDPDILCIRSIHQLCTMFSKIELDCSTERIDRAYRGYLATEEKLREVDSALTAEHHFAFRVMFNRLFGDVMNSMNKSLSDDFMPYHSSGSTADKRLGNQKYSCLEYTDRLSTLFPYQEMYQTSYLEAKGNGEVNYLGPRDERPVKVIHVPKTLKTPRIIAMEPSYVQYIQQGFLRLWSAAVEDCPLASQLVQTSTQEYNQNFAKTGSLTGDLATLDLSEASDRVLNSLVNSALSPFPLLKEAIGACRTARAELPSGDKIDLVKFASMGSALCFPFEAMVFTTLVFMGYERCYGPLSRARLFDLALRTQVYGDDIITPVHSVHYVIESLQAFGAVVNRRKSFWTGKFRESCGKDYYLGRDVSPIKVRSMLPSSRTDVTEIVSTVSLRNQLSKAGYFASADFLDSLIERLIPFPEVEDTSPVLGKHVSSARGERFCTALHKPLVKGCIVVGNQPVNEITGYPALRKVLAKGDMLFIDARHLRRSGRPRSVSLKTRWASVR